MDFSSKYSRDERFKNIEKMRDRETYFNDYIAEVRKKEKEEKERKREQVSGGGGCGWGGVCEGSYVSARGRVCVWSCEYKVKFVHQCHYRKNFIYISPSKSLST